MSLQTAYHEWRIEADQGVSASIGPVSGTYATFDLIGEDQETFDVRFVGTGVGAAIGLRLSNAQQMALDTASSVGDQVPTLSESRAVAFVGRTRSATSFGGVGHLIELSATLGVGLTFQILLFNVALGPPQMLLALQTAVRFARGELNRSNLNHLAPAVTLLYSPSVGGGAGATIYVGHFDVSTHNTYRRTPRLGVGAMQSMNRRYRPNR